MGAEPKVAMYVFRMKVEELTARSLSLLKLDLSRCEATLRKECQVREMNVVADERVTKGELDIYLALDDFIDTKKLCRVFDDLRSMIDINLKVDEAPTPRVSTELIHI
jgi:hypothetical protein